jgi:signal transduction histidine kinase
VVDNAIKYSPPGGTVTIEVADLGADLSADLSGGAGADLNGGAGAGVGVTVTDDGPGVPADELDHVAERFWRSPRAGGEGTGLGMSIAKALLERYDGELMVSRTAERGLQVTLVVRGVVTSSAGSTPPRQGAAAASR